MEITYTVGCTYHIHRNVGDTTVGSIHGSQHALSSYSFCRAQRNTSSTCQVTLGLNIDSPLSTTRDVMRMLAKTVSRLPRQSGIVSGTVTRQPSALQSEVPKSLERRKSKQVG